MEYLILPWLIGSLVGAYFASSKPHLISGLFRRKIRPRIQVTVFRGLFAVWVAVIWMLYDVPEPGIQKFEPLPGAFFELIA